MYSRRHENFYHHIHPPSHSFYFNLHLLKSTIIQPSPTIPTIPNLAQNQPLEINDSVSKSTQLQKNVIILCLHPSIHPFHTENRKNPISFFPTFPIASALTLTFTFLLLNDEMDMQHCERDCEEDEFEGHFFFFSFLEDDGGSCWE